MFYINKHRVIEVCHYKGSKLIFQDPQSTWSNDRQTVFAKVLGAN